MNSITLGDREIGDGHRPFIIAELGTNFRDDLELAERLVDEAAAAGADAVKFQTHIPEAEMVQGAMRDLGFGDLYDRIGRYALTVEEHRRLKARAVDNGVCFLSTPFSVEAVDRLGEVGVPAIKVGSGELTNYYLLRTAAETGKPLLISTGMADLDTVQAAVEFVMQYTDKVALLYCVSEYPAEPSAFHFGVIDEMKARFDVPVGFSDHSLGIQASAIAMARGADIIEKHFTLDRRLPGGDQSVSIEPEELESLVEYALLTHSTDSTAKPVTSAEADVAGWAHHSIVARERLEEGVELTTENVTTKRPGTGIPASRYFDVLGLHAAATVPVDTVLREEHVKGYQA